jgi:hypothetical protein
MLLTPNISRLKSKKNLKKLRKLLYHKEQAVRQEAARALTDLLSTETDTRVLGAFLGCTHADIRRLSVLKLIEGLKGDFPDSSVPKMFSDLCLPMLDTVALVAQCSRNWATFERRLRQMLEEFDREVIDLLLTQGVRQASGKWEALLFDATMLAGGAPEIILHHKHLADQWPHAAVETYQSISPRFLRHSATANFSDRVLLEVLPYAVCNQPPGWVWDRVRSCGTLEVSAERKAEIESAIQRQPNNTGGSSNVAKKLAKELVSNIRTGNRTIVDDASWENMFRKPSK